MGLEWQVKGQVMAFALQVEPYCALPLDASGFWVSMRHRGKVIVVIYVCIHQHSSTVTLVLTAIHSLNTMLYDNGLGYNKKSILFFVYILFGGSFLARTSFKKKTYLWLKYVN